VKNQDYPDILYVSDLIAPDTVNTMPEKTLRSYADHGSPGKPIQKTYDEAAQVMKAVVDASVDLDEVFAVPRERGNPEVHRFRREVLIGQIETPPLRTGSPRA
jgi:transaldolase